MISGIIRLSIGPSNFVIVAIPCDKTANTILNGCLGPKADVAGQIPDIGEGFRYVSGLHRQHILYRGSTQLLLQKGHHTHKLFRMMIPDIVELRRRTTIISRNAIDKTRYYTASVIDIGKVAAHLAIIKKLNRPAFNDRLGKQKNCHIGPTPWPVDGKKPQPGDRKPVKVAVGMSHQLVGLFGRGIKTNGMIGLVIDRTWHLSVVAINRR